MVFTLFSIISCGIEAIPFFFRLASNAFSDIGSVGRIEKKKKKRNLKKNHKKSRNSRPWYPRMRLKVNINTFGNAQYTEKNVLVFVPAVLCAVTMLIFQIKRIISSEKWFNYVVTVSFFENAKNLGRSNDAKRRKR